MPLRFNCNVCDGNITVKYLSVGEIAECKYCGAKVIVPKSAQITNDEPDYTRKYSDRERFITIKTDYDNFIEGLDGLESVSGGFLMIGIFWFCFRLIDCLYKKKPKAYQTTKAREIIFDKILKKMDIIGKGRIAVNFDEIKKIVYRTSSNVELQKGNLELVLSNNSRIEISGHNNIEVIEFANIISKLLEKPVEYDMDIQSYRESREKQIFIKAQEKIN